MRMIYAINTAHKHKNSGETKEEAREVVMCEIN